MVVLPGWTYHLGGLDAIVLIREPNEQDVQVAGAVNALVPKAGNEHHCRLEEPGQQYPWLFEV